MIGAENRRTELGFGDEEVFSVGTINPYVGLLTYSIDYYRTYTQIPIDSQFMFGQTSQGFPDVYRGGLPGEVYVSSWFPDNRYRVSLSADTGHTFHHVYVSEVYLPGGNTYPFFMSDREPGVFYILKTYQIEDFNPWGHHTKVCIEYYRDYGETLVDIYCHDLHKDYGKTCEAVNDLVLEKIDNNSILLTWGEPESSLPVRGYQVFRNEELLSEELATHTYYLDENLPEGNYEYYVVAYYDMDCISDSSNNVKVEIEVGIRENEEKEKVMIYPNPAFSTVTIEANNFNKVEIYNAVGQLLKTASAKVVDVSAYNSGIYFFKVFDTDNNAVVRRITVAR